VLASETGLRARTAHEWAAALDRALESGEALVLASHERLTILEALARMGEPLHPDLVALQQVLSDFWSSEQVYGVDTPEVP